MSIKTNAVGGLLFVWTVFAVALQVQWTLPIGTGGLRCSASDLLLPLLIIMMAHQPWIHKKWMLSWKPTWLPLWFLAFGAWLFISLWQGQFYLHSNELSHWGLINKCVGWFILMGYFIVGGFLVLSPYQYQERWIKTLFMTSWIISSFVLVLLLLNFHGSLNADLTHFAFGVNDQGRPTGLLKNPTTFSLFCCFIIFLQMPFFKQKQLFSSRIHMFGTIVNTIVLFFAASRGVWLALLGGLGVLLVKNVLNKQLIKTLLIATLVCGIGMLCLCFGKTYRYILREGSLTLKDHSVQARVVNMEQALQEWIEKPITGIGLGSFYAKQKQRDPENAIIIHNTLLWVLTETGIIGAGILFVFIWGCFKEIYTRDRKIVANNITNSIVDNLAKSGVAILVSFGIASLFSEVLYQRYLWLLLGMLLVNPLLIKNKMDEPMHNSREFVLCLK